MASSNDLIGYRSSIRLIRRKTTMLTMCGLTLTRSMWLPFPRRKCRRTRSGGNELVLACEYWATAALASMRVEISDARTRQFHAEEKAIESASVIAME